ncbi:hypothetical protein EJB05_55721 [Eragrostis curvula]|uniref:DDE Tnp4 domain-containing protein n=1 Tax=Eragrostis curvula TaxID=38414 RepID=A0A5J9SIR2_9POAL|nr:hypothetical protein EJB05_55721 [Eragrostis curvula]
MQLNLQDPARCKDNLHTISRKTSNVAEIMFRWAQTILVPADRQYTQVRSELAEYAPWFDGCIGAIDDTHIPVEICMAASPMWEPGRRVHVMTWRFYKIVKRIKGSCIHPQLRNIIEKRFGHLKERWHILEGVPFFKREKQARMIISCCAMDNYLWLCKYGDGATYDPSEWVLMNTTTNTSTLRELVSAAVWPAR